MTPLARLAHPPRQLLPFALLALVSCGSPDAPMPMEHRVRVAAQSVSHSGGPTTPELVGGAYVIADVTTTHVESDWSGESVIDMRTGHEGNVVHTEFPATSQRIETGIALSGHQVFSELTLAPDPE